MPRASSNIAVVCGSLLLMFAYWLIFVEPFFPNQSGAVGHDYEGSLGEAVLGAIHFHQNGFLHIPWFTPATCGGDMFVAGVINPYFNVQQWLTFFLDPLVAAQISFLLFALLGFCGTYFLLRAAFRLDPAGAMFGAGIMLFNGFFAYRMITGHTAFHSFMLIPLIAALILTARPGKVLFNITASALLLTYATLASGAYVFLSAAMAITGILLIHNLKFPQRQLVPYGYFSLALLLMFVMCAFKILLSYQVSVHLPRDQYLLPGIPHAITTVLLPIRLLFFSAPEWWEETRFLMTNYEWNIDRHEMEMGVTWVALAAVILGLIRSKLRLVSLENPLTRLAMILLGLLLTVPLILNFYHPAWNSVIKATPVLNSFSLFVRLYSVYIPLLAVFSALAFAFVPRARVLVSAAALILVVATHALTDKGYYHHQKYNPSLLSEYHASFLEGVAPPPSINMIGDIGVASYGDITQRIRNETFVFGTSNVNCKNDMFGYRLENFPKRELLQPGKPVNQLSDGHFNMKNPACYVYPGENGCEPGDHFTRSQAQELKSFTSYDNYDFQFPWYQQLANWISGTTILAAILTLIVTFLMALRAGARGRETTQ